MLAAVLGFILLASGSPDLDFASLARSGTALGIDTRWAICPADFEQNGFDRFSGPRRIICPKSAEQMSSTERDTGRVQLVFKSGKATASAVWIVLSGDVKEIVHR
ncbi:MAG: hypothetical protein WDO13_18180 [Verrucomicrobiota bacterium]